LQRLPPGATLPNIKGMHSSLAQYNSPEEKGKENRAENILLSSQQFVGM